MGQTGVAVTLMQDLPTAHYYGELFDDNIAVLIPPETVRLGGNKAFVARPEFANEVRKFNQKLAVKTQYLVKVPFDINNKWNLGANESSAVPAIPNGCSQVDQKRTSFSGGGCSPCRLHLAHVSRGMFPPLHPALPPDQIQRTPTMMALSVSPH